MYNYDFKKNEEQIVLEKENGIVEIKDNTYNLSIVVTNKNILLFNNVNKNNPLSGRGVLMPEEYYLELAIPLQTLDYEVEDNNTIINYKNAEIVLYDLNINECL